MRSFILTAGVAAIAALLAVNTQADATPPHGHGAHGPAHAYVHPQGPAFHSAHIGHYRARGYHGWSWRCWYPRYGCYAYYCGEDATWYYWYEPMQEYLPISYLPTYAPTPVTAPVLAPVAAPVAAPALPPGATLVPGSFVAP